MTQDDSPQSHSASQSAPLSGSRTPTDPLSESAITLTCSSLASSFVTVHSASASTAGDRSSSSDEPRSSWEYASSDFSSSAADDSIPTSPLSDVPPRVPLNITVSLRRAAPEIDSASYSIADTPFSETGSDILAASFVIVDRAPATALPADLDPSYLPSEDSPPHPLARDAGMPRFTPTVRPETPVASHPVDGAQRGRRSDEQCNDRDPLGDVQLTALGGPVVPDGSGARGSEAQHPHGETAPHHLPHPQGAAGEGARPTGPLRGERCVGADGLTRISAVSPPPLRAESCPVPGIGPAGLAMKLRMTQRAEEEEQKKREEQERARQAEVDDLRRALLDAGLAGPPPEEPPAFQPAALVPPSQHPPPVLEDVHKPLPPFPVPPPIAGLGAFSALPILSAVVLADMGKKVVACELVAQDEWRKTCDVRLEDGTEVAVFVYSASMPKTIVESEVATMTFVRQRTSIPVPRVLHFSPYNSKALGPYAIVEKPRDGVRLDTLFSHLPEFEQDLIVMQWARWTSELSQPEFSLPALGSLIPGCSPHGIPNIGPLLHLPFYSPGRAGLTLDRGPWPTTHAYRLACAQRELDCARSLSTSCAQGISEEYRREVEEGQLRAKKSAALVMRIADHAREMDELDPALAMFGLDMHELGLRNIVVDAYDPTRILAVTDWIRATSRPLWRCAQIPRWIAHSSLAAAANSSTIPQTPVADHARLERVFRAMLNAERSPISHALDTPNDDARLALDDVLDYDAVTDGFLLLPALQSIAATLPGQEDTEGFAALLDPHTLAGRALRVNLVTKSFGALAFTPAEPPRGIEPERGRTLFRQTTVV